MKQLDTKISTVNDAYTDIISQSTSYVNRVLATEELNSLEIDVDLLEHELAVEFDEADLSQVRKAYDTAVTYINLKEQNRYGLESLMSSYNDYFKFDDMQVYVLPEAYSDIAKLTDNDNIFKHENIETYVQESIDAYRRDIINRLEDEFTDILAKAYILDSIKMNEGLANFGKYNNADLVREWIETRKEILYSIDDIGVDKFHIPDGRTKVVSDEAMMSNNRRRFDEL